ncbi:MAG TPA: YifB family Mg chelatase-like AAA ATPase [Clostridiaceae bacterium]|nr:YifB family Mg chelatase-like AAA ATPase [Clostridiaceae bacterium]
MENTLILPTENYLTPRVKPPHYGYVAGACLHGINGQIVGIEVSISLGLPITKIVGMADQAVREALNRIRASLTHIEEGMPRGRITVNLMPGWLPKSGTGFDLPIALAIMIAKKGQEVPRIGAIGELSLQGDVLPVNGLLPQVQALCQEDLAYIFVPAKSIKELISLSDPRIIGIESLKEAAFATQNTQQTPQYILDKSKQRIIDHNAEEVNKRVPAIFPGTLKPTIKLRDLPGQRIAVRGLAAACAGGHHTLLIGSPGCGKTVMARFAGALLPPLEEQDTMDLLAIYSAAGHLKNTASTHYRPPIRSPHYTISVPNLIGGGHVPKPGEISLAHCGILFIDEITSVAPATLAAMRIPLEEGNIELIRRYQSYRFPCQFILIAAANPCPCGHLLDQDETIVCRCSSASIAHYYRKLKGAFADRIDLRIEIRKLSAADLSLTLEQTSWLQTETLKQQVHRARVKQLHRNGKTNDGRIVLNSRLPTDVIPDRLLLSPAALRQAKRYAKLTRLSIRSFYKLLRVARTFADLDEAESVEAYHLAEAMQYKNNDLREEGRY